MSPSTLTIGQLAAHVGVTVRAVRHYHACGLLREPARDVSGYRRYDAQADVDLIRIKTLAEAGAPLARIRQLLDAGPAEFTDAVAAIDRGLRTKIREMQRRRRRLGQLAEGERLFLPAGIVDILDQLRAHGVSEHTVQIERDAWILMAALLPKALPEWIDEKRAALADPGLQRLYLAADQARDWDPADPRLEELVATLVDFAVEHQHPGSEPPDWTVDEAAAISLLGAHVADVSPAWVRLNDTVQERLRALGHPRDAP
jgi:DNA-binding transcriptional MerR regulator